MKQVQDSEKDLMFNFPQSIIALAETLERGWETYRADGEFDAFVEFTLSLYGLTEHLNRQHLPGLVRACQELENTALSLFAAIAAIGSSSGRSRR